jgi:uncharacterized membrane protein YuzA (DUF378 family)
MASKRINFFLGFLSLFGLLGFRYFFTHNPVDLSYFVNFAFISNFFASRIDLDSTDEHHRQNAMKASAYAYTIASAEIFVIFAIGLVLTLFGKTSLLSEIFLPLTAICYTVAVVSYTIELYRFEQQQKETMQKTQR